MGFKGVFIARTCFPDVEAGNRRVTSLFVSLYELGTEKEEMFITKTRPYNIQICLKL